MSCVFVRGASCLEGDVFSSKPTPTGDLLSDVSRYLVAHGCQGTVVHSRAVAMTAQKIAARFRVCEESAVVAGWLHDISAVIPNSERIAAARNWGLAVLPEEVALPMIVHQKLSAWMAEHLFKVKAPEILDAIRCHTTLRAGATSLDRVVFVADKIAWDQPGTPPYLDGLQAALRESLTGAACVYLTYLWRQRDQLPVVHPWLVAAHADLCLSGQPKLG